VSDARDRPPPGDAAADTRNVVDRYKGWAHEDIVADLDARRHPFHVAVENWQHDLNIGAVVRNANAFLAAAVHIVGRRRWNRRGAMVTDRYQHLHHARARAAAARRRQPPRLAPDRRLRSPRVLRPAVRPGGTGPLRRRARALRGDPAHPPVRLDPLDQRRRRQRRGDARVDPPSRACGLTLDRP
jgi:hypothetical protein